MNEKADFEKEKRLQDILDTMDIPERRKLDLQWLSRNISIWNSVHPDFQEAIKIIKELLLNKDLKTE